MILNRELQLKLLKKMSSAYPNFYDFNKEYNRETVEYDAAIANLYYLMQHKLVEPNSVIVSTSIGDKGIKKFQFGSSTINQNGLDFLADDGGLSAILGVVTVKFEAVQLKAILESKIMAADLPPADKHKLIDGLRSLSGESIKHLTTKIVDLGWDNLGTLIRIIQSSLS
ncbi:MULTISPECIES: hypothetical protein [Acinetobacter]|uniref:hypothetical protein n=1 Tax=Acinetobacter TaxID=469 RepID=UPI00148C71F3|nr:MULTISPECIES: hypothetical protein [Acinetobacter]MBJ8501382.1 hypothetical protein [Acinetobacter pittii]MBJ9891597.1 hypothetical protein [Acinetobacter pittii]MCU4478209.1 hypothetical protein [Acinetobacter sp. WU_MDCI_Abxd143]